MSEINKGGRPRTYDRDEIEQQLMAWAFREDSTNMTAFSAEYLIAPSVMLKWAKADPEGFGQTYDVARSLIATRREMLLSRGQLHVKAYDLNAAHYDRYLKADQREDKQHEAELKSGSAQDAPQAVVDTFNALNDTLKGLQSKGKGNG